MPPWRKERVREALPFEYTGLDYFGPLYIKYYDGNEKDMSMFIYLHGSKGHTPRTCWRYVSWSVPAVLTSVCGMMRYSSSDTIWQCKTIQISLKGIKVLNKVQQETPLDDEINDYLSKQGIHWKLIVELAPWMGGFYERLVGLTKKLLEKQLARNV